MSILGASAVYLSILGFSELRQCLGAKLRVWGMWAYTTVYVVFAFEYITFFGYAIFIHKFAWAMGCNANGVAKLW